MPAHVGVIQCDIALKQSTHEHETTTRAVVLVLEIHVGGAGLQAEPAMHTGVKTGGGMGERSARQRTSW